MKTPIAAVAFAVAGFVGAASAAPIFALDAIIVADGPRGTADNRADIANAFGDDATTFFELGRGAIVDFTFGQLFTGGLVVKERTFGDVTAYPESAMILGGRDGAFEALTTVTNRDAQGAGFAFLFEGVYDTLRLVDTTTFARSQGFDVASIRVESVPAAVPLPASALLLAAGLVALGVARRRRPA